MLTDLGSTNVSIYFTSQDGKVIWPAFLGGYEKCCMQASAYQYVNLMFILFHTPLQVVVMSHQNLISKLALEWTLMKSN